MKKKSAIKARWATALWLGGIFLLVWIIFMTVLTWCTAKTMDRYLEKENGQIASNIVSAAQLQKLAEDPALQAETGDYWIWSGTNSNWLNNNFSGGLLRTTRQKPQTAVALYDGNGKLLEKSGNCFYIYYMTEESWKTQELDMHYDGVAKALYDPSWITDVALQVIQRNDWIALRFTGTIEDGYLTPSRIEDIRESEYRSIAAAHYGDGSYERHQRIQEMEAKYGLQWDTLLASSNDAADQQTYYVLNGAVSYYDPGEALEVDGISYKNLMDYVLQIEDTSIYNDYYSFKRGDLWNTLITDTRRIYSTENGELTPAYQVVAAVRYSPMKLAMESLLYVYVGSFLLLLLAAFLLWRIMIRNLVLPLQTVHHAAVNDWGSIGYWKDRVHWREPRQLCADYDRTRTERAKQQDELSRLAAALHYAKEAEINRRQMTSSLAHELKTPLAIIHSYAEGLKEHIAEEKRDQYVDVILSEVTRTDNMVLEMLDLSRLEAGKVKLTRNDFSLIELTRDIFEKLDLAAQAKELTVQFSFPEEFTVTADEGRIAQVIENLATNAIKYSPAGGCVQVKIISARNRTTFRIANESAPLSEEALRKVWDTFYRTDEARSGAGTGLGLAIAKSIVELHGGTCSVQNTSTGVEFGFMI